MARRSPGVSGLYVTVAAGGLWLAYAGVKDVPPITGLRDLLRGRKPAERDTDAPFTPAKVGVNTSDSFPSFGPPGKIVPVTGIQGGVDASIAPAVATLINRARHNAGASLTGGGWRSSLAQAQLRIKNGCTCRDSSSCCKTPTAPVGESLHERGLAVDWSWNGQLIRSRDSAGFRFLQANAPGLGFKNLPSEPWHWSTTGG